MRAEIVHGVSVNLRLFNIASERYEPPVKNWSNKKIENCSRSA